VRSRLVTLRWVLCVSVALTISAGQPIAGDSWNLLGPSAEAPSRQASATLFRSAAHIFGGLAELELKSYSSSRKEFAEARILLHKASDALASLAKDPAASKSLSVQLLQPVEVQRLTSWYRLRSGQPDGFGPDHLRKLTAADLLAVAAGEAKRIGTLVGESYSDVSGDNPQRAGNVIREIADFLYIGTIAARAFAG